ncbi:ATP-binding protein [Halobacillus seohaensis]|uniref:AAA family ATPase n=1 Tax=Halobacillus seohaensis TaxID=447421 RepID=A0ABW2EMQ1_9BACI
MKILSFHIYGFGKWKDYSLSLAEQPMNIIIGNNEAGKSTIQQFILFILFGLPPKKREFFQPKTGGTVGGRLVLETKDYGEVVVERIHDRNQAEAVCWLANGEKYEETFLRKLLGGLSRSVYQSIYSFNAEDLNDLQQLTGQELGEVLLNIGLTGSDQIYQTEKFLEKELEQQFKPKGKKPKLNQELQSLDKLSTQRSEVEKNVGDYQKVVEKINQLNQDSVELDELMEKKRLMYYSYSQIKKAIPIVQEYHHVKNKDNFDFSFSFPMNAREEMRQFQEKILPLESEQRSIEEARREKSEHLSLIKQEQQSFSEEDIHEILNHQPTYEQSSLEYQRLKKQLEHTGRELKSELSNLDIPIDEDSLMDYDFPFYLEETWRSLNEEIRQLNQEESQRIDEENILKQQYQQTERQISDLEKQTIGDDEASENSELIDRYIHSNNDSHQQKEVPNYWNKPYLIITLVVMAGMLLSILTSNIFPVSLAIFTSIGVISYFYSKSPSYKQGEAPISDNQRTITKEMYTKARQLLQQYEQAKGELAYLREYKKELDQKDSRIMQQKKKINESKKRLDEIVQEQYRLYPFLKAIKVVHWEKLYHLLKQLKDKQRVVQSNRDEMDTLEKRMVEIENLIVRFFDKQDWKNTEELTNDKFLKISDFYHRQSKLQEEQGHLNQELSILNDQKERVKEKVQPVQMMKDQLLQSVEATDVEQFYSKLDRHEEIKERQKQESTLKSQIHMMLSKKEQEMFNVWSVSPNESEISFQLEKQEQDIQQVNLEQKDLQQERANYSHKKDQLESSDHLSSLNHQYELDRAQFNEQAKEWATYKIALDVLEKTKEIYQNNYLPHVLEVAKQYFRKITLGKYVNLYLDPLHQKIMVKDCNEYHYTTEELSRGTADQLYISLRLALAKTLSSDFAVPFLVDDAFVHFDEARLSIMLEIFNELSSSNQILLFTWRKDLLTKIDRPYAKSFQLNEG